MTEISYLTTIESAIIYGTLLGDGTIVKRGNSYRLKIDHGIDQKDYVQWKHQKLQRLCQTTQPPKITKDKRGFEGVEFYTTSGLYLKPYHDLFYKKAASGRYEKRITQELIDSLPMNPYVLAAVFMDDGSVRNDCYAGKLAFQGYPREDIELFVQYLNKWGIQASIARHTVKSGQYYLNLNAATFGNLVKIIEPIVREIPSLQYKLNENLKPRND